MPFEVYLEAGATLDAATATFPALIKPACADGSLGITQNAVVKGPDEAAVYLEWLQRKPPERAVLVQEFLSGNEYSIGLVEGNVKRMEVNTSPAWAHDAKLNLMAGFGGMSHGQLLGSILEVAKRRTGLTA